jgi:hypothetical protein
MQENTKLIVSLLERATEYGKTSLELAKLKSLDKISDVVSSFIPHTLVFVIFATFLVFFNLGIAFWLGKILGETYYGFFIVAAFYFLIGIFIHFFLHNKIKKLICNYIIKRVLK